MLSTLRNELTYYKGKINDVNFELQEKTLKIEANEKKLVEPVPPLEVINRMEGQLVQLNSGVSNLESKIEAERDNAKEDKLSIFRQQAAVVTGKKEELEKTIKSDQDSRMTMELEIEKQKKELEKIKGPNAFKNNDFEVFQGNLNDKMVEKNKKQEELDALDEEYGILKRTEQILKASYKESFKKVKTYEKKYNMEGLLNIENELDDLTQQKGNVDLLKGKTLEELSTIVEQLKIKIDEKRDKLKPLLDEHKKIKAIIVKMDEEHKAKKADFERVIRPLQKEYEMIDNDSRDKKNIAFEYEISAELYKEKTQVLDLVKEMLDKEKASSAANELGTCSSLMQNEITVLEKDIQVLKVTRDRVKNISNNLSEQTDFLGDLKMLLEEKLKCRKRVKHNTTLSFKNSKEHFNQVIVE